MYKTYLSVIFNIHSKSRIESLAVAEKKSASITVAQKKFEYRPIISLTVHRCHITVYQDIH